MEKTGSPDDYPVTEYAKEMDALKSFPRRSRLDLNTDAELAIYNAIQEVEKVGADVRLTDTVILLQKAKEKLAEYVDDNL